MVWARVVNFKLLSGTMQTHVEYRNVHMTMLILFPISLELKEQKIKIEIQYL